MRLFRPALVFALLASSVAVGVAQESPHEAREALMKNNGRAMSQLAPIAKGEKPFDQAVVDQALAALDADAKKMIADRATLFPEGSGEGEGNEASPAIWSNADGFTAELEKFSAATGEAVAAKPADAAGVGAAIQKIGGSCSSCHQGFRVRS